MSASSTDPLAGLRAWRRARYPHALFVPVALVLTLTSVVAAPSPVPLVLAARLGLAWSVVLALRLWDDLEDREADAVTHPERVLVQSTRLGPFVALAAALLLAALPAAYLLGGLTSAVVLGALCPGLLVFYRLGGQRRPGGRFLLLLKYPLLVMILRGSVDPEGLAVMALIYGGVCLDEALQRARGGIMAAVVLLLLTLHWGH